MTEPTTTMDTQFSDPHGVVTSWDETRRLLVWAALGNSGGFVREQNALRSSPGPGKAFNAWCIAERIQPIENGINPAIQRNVRRSQAKKQQPGGKQRHLYSLQGNTYFLPGRKCGSVFSKALQVRNSAHCVCSLRWGVCKRDAEIFVKLLFTFWPAWWRQRLAFRPGFIYSARLAGRRRATGWTPGIIRICQQARRDKLHLYAIGWTAGLSAAQKAAPG